MIELLDHGYLKLIETWGSDERIIESARMSTQKGFAGWGPNWKCKTCGCLWRDNQDDTVSLLDPGQASCQECEHSPTPGACVQVAGDEKLLRYLHENNHATPFEFAGLVIEVKAPIMVFREWHRHRTQSYNEMSARYTPLPNANYIPSVERLLINSKKNKQAGTVKGAGVLDEAGAMSFQVGLREEYGRQELLYQHALRNGVPKELARCVLPVGRYSRMRASTCLRNWLAFLTLRMDKAAQWEIRQYANAVFDIISEKFPRTAELFLEGM